MRKNKEPKSTIRIIDNKKVWVTDDEFRYYGEICKGYDRPNFQGSELFKDHFEVNNDGIIIFVKPPYKQYSSLEVYTFLISLMVNQHLRLSRDQMMSFVKEASTKFEKELKELQELKQELKEKIDSL